MATTTTQAFSYDDLPELLGAPGWPDAVARLLFDPEARHADAPSYRRVVSWDEAQSRLLDAIDSYGMVLALGPAGHDLSSAQHDHG